MRLTGNSMLKAKAPSDSPGVFIMDNQKWIFSQDGKSEEVALERWVWGVVYQDGTELHQFDNSGVFHRIGEVDQDRVSLFVLYKSIDMGKRIDIVVPEGARLIHKYRNYVFNAGTPQESKARVYVFGYRSGKHYHYNFVLPDDRIVQSVDDEVKLTNFALQ